MIRCALGYEGLSVKDRLCYEEASADKEWE